jgi:hypothetical protein
MNQPLFYDDGSALSELDRKLAESYFQYHPTTVGVDKIRDVDDIARLRDKLESQAKAEPEDTTIKKQLDQLYDQVRRMDLFLVSAKVGMAEAMGITGTYRRVRIFNTDEALFVKSAETRMVGRFESETEWIPDFDRLNRIREVLDECVREHKAETDQDFKWGLPGVSKGETIG